MKNTALFEIYEEEHDDCLVHALDTIDYLVIFLCLS